MHIQLHAQNFELSDALRDYAQDKVEHLARYASDILSANITFERNFHHRQGDVCRIKVQLQVTGPDIYADAEHEDFYAAVDKVQEMLEKQLKKRH